MDTWQSVKKKGKKKAVFVIAFLMLVVFLIIFLFVSKSKDRNLVLEKENISYEKENEQEQEHKSSFQVIKDITNFFHHIGGPDIPPPPSMDWIKYEGCVVDGILNGYGGKTKEMIRMINRSECKYLHRALETWLEAPDFKEVEKNLKKLDKNKEFVLGMFFAEAINKKEKFYYPAEERNFDFSKMCREGSDNYWGEHTCQPSFSKSEYRKYVLYVAEKAMDLGIQVFLFGQVYYQDSVSDRDIAQVIAQMKEYSQFKGMKILIGAQTNDIIDEEYLALFDFIEGGVGIDQNGNIENQPCSSKWWDKEKGGWCWALLWHEKYFQRANNVIVHLDWSGKRGDDMSIFAKMSPAKRITTLERLYFYFKSKEVGFLMPFLAVIPEDNGSCYGPKKGYYSASNEYGCGDENGINKILRRAKKQ